MMGIFLSMAVLMKILHFSTDSVDYYTDHSLVSIEERWTSLSLFVLKVGIQPLDTTWRKDDRTSKEWFTCIDKPPKIR